MQQHWEAPPTEFTGKTWIFIVTAFVFGVLATFSFILGSLFLFEIMKDARGQALPPNTIGFELSVSDSKMADWNRSEFGCWSGLGGGLGNNRFILAKRRITSSGHEPHEIN